MNLSNLFTSEGRHYEKAKKRLIEFQRQQVLF